ncbi:extracellular aspartic proteinase [Phycomyces nitens]|nr:extracellular aspartic proteinase [Phycomyces nitens]
MKLSACILGLLAFATFSAVDSAPSVSDNLGAKTLTIPLVQNSGHERNAARAVLKARKKHQIYSNRLVTRAKTGTLPTVGDATDSEYYGIVKVGTPPQSLKLHLDSGSALLWFASTLCTNCGTTHTKFDSKKSTTYKDSTQPWSATYAEGSSASGIIGYDTVDIGGVSIPGQSIGLAKTESSTFQTDVVDGMFGLSFGKLVTTVGFKTPMDNMISQGLITEPVFSSYFGRYAKGSGGEFVFGGYNPNHVGGPFTTIPVNSTAGVWHIKVSDASSGTTASPTSFGAFDGVLDTGTSLILLPDAVATKVAKFYGAVDKLDGSYTISCDTSKFSPLTFTIAGTKFSIPPADLIFSKKTTCTASFGYGGLPVAIFGTSFLKNFYVIHNMKIPNVQIALAK